MARILVVDDDRRLHTMIELMLQRGGHTVALAGSGQDGFMLATAEPFDLVITDVMMPEMDGYELTRRLRADERTKDVRILVLTARAQPVDYESAMGAGADGYIAKPITHDILLEKVEKLLAAAPRTADEAALKGHLISVLGLRGGVGTTTVAVNLALGLLRARIRTCLIDLSPACGHVAMQLRLRPKPTWNDLPANSEQDEVGRMLLKHASGLHVLAAPTQPVRHGFPPAQFEHTLAAVNNFFSVTVVDSAPWLDEATFAALERAYAIILVLTPDVGSVQTLTGTLRVLTEAGIAPNRMRHVLNHVTPAAGLPQSAVEKALGRPVDAVVPYEAAQAQALIQGQPLMMTQPDSALPATIGRLISTL